LSTAIFSSQEAYRHLQSVDPSGGKDAVDEFLQDWLEESKVPGWGDFSQIESPAKVVQVFPG